MPASSNTTVALTNDSTRLTCDVSLRNLTITGVPGGTPALTLDWADMVTRMATNALGGRSRRATSPARSSVTSARRPPSSRRSSSTSTMIATEYYRADIASGAILDFTTLTDSAAPASRASTTRAPGWSGLICGNCRNPAPWYMTILKPCTPS